MPLNSRAFLINIVAPGLLVACQSTPVLSPPPLAAALKPLGYIVLPIADSGMTPGSVIQVTPEGGGSEVRWLGHIHSCGLTDDDLGLGQPNDIGAITSNSSYSVDANVAIDIARIAAEIKPQLSAAKTAVLKIDKAQFVRIDLIKTSSWFAVPAHVASVPQACNDWLSRSNVYLVTEGVRVTGSYSFKDSAGAGVNVTPASGKSVSASGNISLDKDGSLVITTPEYVAIKDAKQLSLGNFAVMGGGGAPSVPTADPILATGSIKSVQ